MRCLLIAALLAAPAVAAEPDLSSPHATLKSYLAATKANDIEAAKACWTIDDGNRSGSLDVVAGVWISSRKLVAATESKLGPDAIKLLGRWNQPSLSDKAIQLTIERASNVVIGERGATATLHIQWKDGDGTATPAFIHSSAPFVFRQIDEQWKLDANVFTGTTRAAERAEAFAVRRDEMAVMDKLTEMLEKGQFKTVADFENELNARVGELKARHAKKD